jgi:hypothetical protein
MSTFSEMFLAKLHNPIAKALKLQKEFSEPHREVSIPHGAYMLTPEFATYFIGLEI